MYLQATVVGQIAVEIDASVETQHKEVDSVVTAMHQMSTTARDVARYAAEAAAESEGHHTNPAAHNRRWRMPRSTDRVTGNGYGYRKCRYRTGRGLQR